MCVRSSFERRFHAAIFWASRHAPRRYAGCGTLTHASVHRPHLRQYMRANHVRFRYALAL